MILNKDLKADVIYTDRLSGDKVLVSMVEPKTDKLPDGTEVNYIYIQAQRYNRLTGMIDTMFYPVDNQLER